MRLGFGAAVEKIRVRVFHDQSFGYGLTPLPERFLAFIWQGLAVKDTSKDRSRGAAADCQSILKVAFNKLDIIAVQRC